MRAHSVIENPLHSVIYVFFHYYLMLLSTLSLPANISTIRHSALNIVKQIPYKASLNVRRNTLRSDYYYLLAASPSLTNHLQGF